MQKKILMNKLNTMADEIKALKRFSLDLTRVILATDVILVKNKDAFRATLTDESKIAELDTILEVMDKIRKDLIMDT